MPIEVSCPGCNRQFRVPDKVAGKKIKCPKCQGILQVPAGDSASGSNVASGSGVGATTGSSVASATKWYMKTPDGSQYGPVPKTELDQWHAEGRITPQCQVLEEGAPQWQWATDLYPQSAGPAAATAQNLAAAPAPAAPAAAPAATGQENPFANLGGQPQQAADNPFAGVGNSTPAAPAGGAPAAPADPFAFAGADTSPTSRIRGGRRGGKRGGRRGGPRSGAVTAVAVVNYILGGLGMIGGIICVALGPILMSTLRGAAADDPEAAEALNILGGIGATFFIVFGVIVIIVNSVMVLAGYGVQIRAQWGRILTLILGGLQIAFGVLSLLSLSPSAVVNFAYGIFVFIVLLNKKNAEEFS